MADVSSNVNTVVSGIVSLLKGLIVLFVFANILYPMGDIDPVTGIIALLEQFMNGEITGLLALLLLVSFID